jgi:hypothetical protein
VSWIGTSQLHRYKPILANASFVVKFIRERHHVLAKFNEFRKRFHISRNLVITVPTRWYTQYNSCKTLIQAKFAVTSLLEEEALLHAIQRQGPVTKFKELVGDTSFWAEVKELMNVLSFPSSIIGKFESDSSDLFVIYDYFKRLGDSWTDIDILNDDVKDTLKEIVKDRWNFIHTESMGFAYLLSPQSLKKKWAANDKAATKGQLKQYISVFYEGNDEAIERCRGELDTYLTNMVNLPYVLEEEFLSLSGKQFWSQYGISDYPFLAKIALRLFTVPTSSAAAERVWSIYSFIHSKRRNRLGIQKVEKLVFIYINHCLLDTIDVNDYIGDDDVSDEEDG